MNRTTTREDTLRRVVRELDDRRDGILPMHLAGVSELFDDATDLLGALQLRWYASLSGLVERELAGRPLDHADAVATAWARARATHPGTRLALDVAAAHPLDADMAGNLRRGAATEHAMLAAMAGLAGVGEVDSLPVGRELERRARALPPVAPVGPSPGPPTGPRDGRRGPLADLVHQVRHLVA